MLVNPIFIIHKRKSLYLSNSNNIISILIYLLIIHIYLSNDAILVVMFTLYRKRIN